jgi:hypothetical protein
MPMNGICSGSTFPPHQAGVLWDLLKIGGCCPAAVTMQRPLTTGRPEQKVSAALLPPRTVLTAEQLGTTSLPCRPVL